MGTRYVWDRYPIKYASISGTSLKKGTLIENWTSYDYDVYLYIADSYTFDDATGKYTLIDPVSLYRTSIIFGDDNNLIVDVGKYFQFKVDTNYSGEATGSKPYGTYRFDFVYQNTKAKGYPRINIYNDTAKVDWGGDGSVAVQLRSQMQPDTESDSMQSASSDSQ